jgi:transcriptional regulator with XRE-family HTH domain
MTEREWYAVLGSDLREARKRRGWTIYDTAAALEVTHTTISRWERGLQRMQAYHYDLLRQAGLLT